MKDLKQLNEEFLGQNTSSIEHVHEYIKVLQSLLKEENSNKFEELAIKALENDKKRNWKVKGCENILRRLKKGEATGENFKGKAHEIFPKATAFR